MVGRKIYLRGKEKEYLKIEKSSYNPGVRISVTLLKWMRMVNKREKRFEPPNNFDIQTHLDFNLSD